MRSAIGNDLAIVVEAEETASISEVTIHYDGSDLARERLIPASRLYERAFREQGDAAPGMSHLLVVTATDASGATETGRSEWEDET